MPEFLTPTTELEAVNAILASVGESPVDALDGEFVDAEIASNFSERRGALASLRTDGDRPPRQRPRS